jgi:DNA invertase Pin-like site-specific DNA recombinase
MVSRRIKQYCERLLEASQATIENWCKEIDLLIAQKPDIDTYNAKKQMLLPKLIEARAKGITLRELARMTGIPYQTIGKWLKEAKAKEQLQIA